MSHEKVIRVFRPKDPNIETGKITELKRAVSEVVAHTDREDLYSRFMMFPNVANIPSTVAGGRTNASPNDTVVVAYNSQAPHEALGYMEILHVEEGVAEMATLVRSDRQKMGVGKAMFQTGMPEAPATTHGSVLIDNHKMIKALRSWEKETPGVTVTGGYSPDTGNYEYDVKNDPQK